MERRNFLLNFFLMILAFIFGYQVKKEGKNMVLHRVESDMVLEKDIKSISKKIEALSKNTLPVVNVFQYGVIPNIKVKAHNNAIIMNTLLSQGKNLYIPEGNIYVNDTIAIPASRSVRGSGSMTKITMIDKDRHLFRLKSRSQLQDLEIYLALGSNKAAIYLNADDKISYAKASKVFVRGYYNQWTLNEDSVAILCEGGENPDGEIYHCHFNEISTWETTVGIKCLQNGASVNGNTFTNLNLINNKYGIDGNPNGSIFTFQTQSPSKLADGTRTGVSAVRCGGAENIFEGYMYDTQYIIYNYEFTSSSRNNSYHDVTGLWKLQKTKDAGKDNVAIGSEKFHYSGFKGVNYLSGADGDGINYEYNGFYGMQDNALSYADKIHTIKLNTGAITYGNVNKIFNADGPFDGTIFENPEITPIEIEVILSNNLYNITHLGILFGTPAKSFEIHTKSNASDAYKLYLKVKDNTKGNWQIHPNVVGISSLAAIKFIFKEALVVPGVYNDSKLVGITSIWCNDSLYGGNTYVRKSGGKIYGFLETTYGISGGAYETLNRPIGVSVGTTYFDTTLGKPIWLKSNKPDVWVDSLGKRV